MSPIGGYAYSVSLVRPDSVIEIAGDTTRSPERSTLSILEDGRPLGPPHALHDDISTMGLGRYSHWGRSVIFSASDNSDPAKNNREYVVRYYPRLSAGVFWAIISVSLIGLLLINKRMVWRVLRRVGAEIGRVARVFGQPPEARPAALQIKPWLYGVLASLLVVIFSLGLLIVVDMSWRMIYSPRHTALGVDLSVYEYRDYVVTTQPANLVIDQNANNPLKSYFRLRECDEPGGISARYNSLGFRAPEFTALTPKTGREIRIVIVGSSAAEGWGIGERCTLPAYLQQFLEDRLKDREVRIFNLSSGAWISIQELFAYLRYGTDIHPDLVVTFDGFNDLAHAFSSPKATPYAGWHVTEAYDRFRSWALGGPLQSLQGLRIVHDMKEFVQNSASKSAGPANYPETAGGTREAGLSTRIVLPIDPDSIAKRTDFDPYNRDIVDLYLRNQRLLDVAAAADGAKTLHVLVPPLYLKAPLSADERKLIETYEPDVNFVVQGYMREAAGLAELTKTQKSSIFLDLSRAFEGSTETYFYDSGHYHPAAYKILAERIADSVVEMLGSKPPAP